MTNGSAMGGRVQKGEWAACRRRSGTAAGGGHGGGQARGQGGGQARRTPCCLSSACSAGPAPGRLQGSRARSQQQQVSHR
jgi:hypothetical protein